MDLTIIIPAHNEELRLGKTLQAYLNYFTQAQILVILNNCQDETEQVVLAYQKQFPKQLKYVNIKAAVGKGGAIINGFRMDLRTEYVGFLDADGSTRPDEYARLLTWLKKYDAVIASRWMAGAKIYGRDSNKRKFASLIFHRLVKILFHFPFADTQTGAKVFSSEAIKKILPNLGTVNNMLFDVDLLYWLQRSQCKIKEVPTVWHDQKGSTVILGRDSWLMFFGLLKLRYRYWRKK